MSLRQEDPQAGMAPSLDLLSLKIRLHSSYGNVTDSSIWWNESRYVTSPVKTRLLRARLKD